MKSVNKIGNISIEISAIGFDLNISDIETTIEASSPEEYAIIMDKKHEHTKEIMAEIKAMVDKIVGALEIVEEDEDEMDIPEFMKEGKHPLEAIFGLLGEDDEQKPSHPLEGLLKQLSEGSAKIHPSQHVHDLGIPLGAILGGLGGGQPKGISLSDLLKQMKDEQEGKDDGFNPFGGKSPFSF